MEKSDTDSLEEWDVVTVSQVLETGTANKGQDEPTDTTTVVTSAKNGLESAAEEKSPVGTPEAVPTKSENVTVAQPENVTKAVPEQCDEDEPRSESESQGEASKDSSPEPESQILVETSVNSKSAGVVAEELEADSKISVNKEEEKSTSSENERSSETSPREAVQDIVCDTPERESSPANIDSGSCQEPDSKDVLEHLVDKIDPEQDLAAIESSSSDIDIIDEVLDESPISTSFMSSPLTLSYGSSAADASSTSSAASQFVEIKYHHQEQKEEPRREYMGGREGLRREEATGSDYPGASSSQRRSKRSPSPKKRDPRQSKGTGGRTFYDWLVLLLQFFQNLSPYDWCLVGAVTVGLYATVILNQTNIFAFVQKDDAVSQMKVMLEELKQDNKILKEQMLSEIKNEKALNSFEHQLKELKKENSKLSHMLFDVAKVLDKQKDFQEKKDSDHILAPFKKEINKLKEYINILKIDNEELQKELVRMRYSDSQTKEKEIPPKEEAQLDVESLKKWNELITLLGKELGVLAEGDLLKGQRSGKDSKPFWKNIINDFKKSFSNFNKANLSQAFNEFKEAKKKVVSDIYVLVKDFFTPEETASGNKDDPQWKSVGDFMEDLKEKWSNIKDRLYASDLRKFFEKGSKKSEAPEERPTTTDRIKIRTTYTQQASNSKPDSTGAEEEDTRWVFERAADREQQRDQPNEDEANWFLKRGRHNSEDKGNRRL